MTPQQDCESWIREACESWIREAFDPEHDRPPTELVNVKTAFYSAAGWAFSACGRTDLVQTCYECLTAMRAATQLIDAIEGDE